MLPLPRIRIIPLVLLLGFNACATPFLPELPDRMGWLLLLGRSASGGGGAAQIGPGSGSVIGLFGHGLTLQMDGSETMRLHRDGELAGVSSAADIRVLSQPVRPAQDCRVRGNGSSVQVECDDDIAPEIIGAAVLSPTRVRVFFSRNMDPEATARIESYRVSETPTGSCGDNSLFTNTPPTPDFAILAAEPGEQFVDLVFDAPMLDWNEYTVIGDRTRLFDRAATPNYLSCSHTADFQNPDPPRLLQARCPGGDRAVLLTFSRPLVSETNAPGSASCTGPSCAERFSISSDLGEVSFVGPPDGSRCAGFPVDGGGSRLCLEHTLPQGEGTYSVIAANLQNGDGFDNVFGIQSAAGEVMGPSPTDRASFAGCGVVQSDAPTVPLAVEDPFSDGAEFARVVAFRDRLIVGPGARGNLFLSYRPDEAGARFLSLAIQRDVVNESGDHGLHENDGNWKYETIGFPGCQPNDGDPVSGCGPHNEDGRGILATGAVWGEEYLFLTGSRSGGGNDYIYYTNELDNRMELSYTDLRSVFNSGPDVPVYSHQATESIQVFAGRVFSLMVGDDANRPYFVKNNGYAGEVQAGSEAVFMDIAFAPGFGPRAALRPALADRLGGTVFAFGSQVYLANTGSVFHPGGYDACPLFASSPLCSNDGGLIRSTDSDPAPCDRATGLCADWVDITPDSPRFRNYFSIVPHTLGELTPARRPFPASAVFAGNLFVIRNACASNVVAPLGADAVCPAGQEVPQLWKCVPAISGAANACDAGDWSLVAETIPSGRTNMGDPGNRWITLLVATAEALYVGFDNPVTGVEIWRTRPGVPNPVSTGDFEQVGADGLGAPDKARFFSAAVLDASAGSIFVTVGRQTGPFALHEIR